MRFVFDFVLSHGIFCYVIKGMYMKKGWIKYITIALAVIVADVFSKGVLLYMVSGHVPVVGTAWELVPYPYFITHVTNFFNIVFTWNPGTAFSLFRNIGEFAPLIIILLTAFVIGFLGHYMFMRAENAERMPLALICGGAFGNLIDRIRFGAVIDFLDFHVGAWHYPSFNVADICICVGVGLYALNWYVAYKRRGAKK